MITEDIKNDDLELEQEATDNTPSEEVEEPTSVENAEEPVKETSEDLLAKEKDKFCVCLLSSKTIRSALRRNVQSSLKLLDKTFCQPCYL